MSVSTLSILAVAVVFGITALAMRLLLPCLKRAHMGQIILEIGPDWHKHKEGTPTMGGLSIILGCLLGGALIALAAKDAFPPRALYSLLLVAIFALGNGLVGAIDDLTKFTHRQNRGLSPLQKLLLQGGISVLFLCLYRLWISDSTAVALPFCNIRIELGFFYYVLLFFIQLWFVNCANLTDGIDGLATSVAAACGIFFLLIATRTDNRVFSLIGACLTGAGTGFLLFNRHPAKVFMGDTGSLFFGGLICSGFFLTETPLLIFIVGIVYLVEGVSVVLQVGFFKLTHGKRLFRMAPFHHHMEKCGWREKQITALATALTVLMAIVCTWGA